MKRALALAAVLGQLALCACSNAGGSSSDANVAAMFVAAPCPAPGEVNPLAGIEAWAPGAGQALKMGQGAQDSFGGGLGSLGGSAPEATATPSPAATGCGQLNPALAANFTKLAKTRAQLPTTGSDVASLAATLKTPDDAFAFVRDQIHTEAYAGVLRGARGTLMARAGSPADKALLLHDLLAAQSVTSRYAHAALADADAAAVVSAATTVAAIDPKGIVEGARAKDALAGGIASAQAQLSKIEALLSARSIALVTDGKAATATLTSRVRDHWWLQAQIGGKWTDFDPTMPSAKSGAHLGPAPTDDPADGLPNALDHTIAVRLIADTGGSAQQVLAHEEASTAAAVESPIVVQMNGDATPDAIATQTSFVPSVSIGDATDAETAFSPDGAARLRVLWLEVEQDGPGAAPIVHRHIVVDRRGADGNIDAAWTPNKTAYAMTFVYRGLEATGDGDAFYNVATNVDAALRGAIAANYSAQHPDEMALPDAAFNDYPYEAHRFFEYDQSVRSALRQADPGLSWTFDHPLIALYRQGFDLNGNDLRFVQSFDIVDDALTAMNGGSVAGAANVERGLMDTSVEGTLISGPGTHLDTAGVFAAARASGAGIGVLAAGDVATAPAAARDVLASSLAGTTVALAPKNAVAIEGIPAYGWLEVDAATGNALGRMASGAGQAMVERSILEKAVEKYSAIKAIGRCVNCFFSGFSEALGGSKQHGQHFGQCLANALCQYAVDFAFDFMAVHGFELDGTGFGLVTGPYSDIVAEIIGNGPSGAICNGVGAPNPYSRPIIG